MDAQLQDLRRRFAESGDPASERRYLLARVRAGSPVPRHCLEVAVHVGDRVALDFLGDHVFVKRTAPRSVHALVSELPGGRAARRRAVLAGGRDLENVNLKDAPTREEFARRIAERAAVVPPGEWVTGGNWDDQAWAPAVMPDATLVDGALRGEGDHDDETAVAEREDVFHPRAACGLDRLARHPLADHALELRDRLLLAQSELTRVCGASARGARPAARQGRTDHLPRGHRRARSRRPRSSRARRCPAPG